MDFKTIRIFTDDHEELIKEFSKDKSFAEIIHEILKERKKWICQ